MHSYLEMEEHGRKAHGGQRGEVVTEPAPRRPHHEHGQDGGYHHDRDLDPEARAYRRSLYPHRKGGKNHPDADEDRLLADHAGGWAAFPAPAGDRAYDCGAGQSMDQRPAPR